MKTILLITLVLTTGCATVQCMFGGYCEPPAGGYRSYGYYPQPLPQPRLYFYTLDNNNPGPQFYYDSHNIPSMPVISPAQIQVTTPIYTQPTIPPVPIISNGSQPYNPTVIPMTYPPLPAQPIDETKLLDCGYIISC